jgi:hypothetical protein
MIDVLSTSGRIWGLFAIDDFKVTDLDKNCIECQILK